MFKKNLSTLSLITIICLTSTSIKPTELQKQNPSKTQPNQLTNIKTIGQLVKATTAPQDIKTYLEEHAPDLVKFAANKKLDAALFSYIAREKKLVIVKFYAEWCPPCQKLKPIVHEVAKEFNDTLVVINIELSPSTQHLLKAFGARGIPTLVFFKDGKKVEQFSGGISKKNLISKIEKIQA